MLSLKIVVIPAVLIAASLAHAGTNYRVHITNGSSMPISPGLIYVTQGQASLTRIGSAPTNAFIKLCQMGNPDDRISEITQNRSTVWTKKTAGPLMPGDSEDFIVPVTSRNQGIHFEAMYGKTKDTCATYQLDGSYLTLSGATRSPVLIAHDEVISTGAFLDPALPTNQDINQVCQNAASAIDCLRVIAHPNPTSMRIRFFPGYLPSVIDGLEKKYGATDTQTLVIPTSGAVRFEIFKN